MFKRGECGNPKGRPPGTAMQAKLKEAVGPRFNDLVQTIMQSALDGDMTAASLLLNRLVPAVRPAQEPTPFPLTGDTLIAKANGLLAAAAEGQLAATDAKLMLDALATVAKLHELEELEQRIAALEGRRHGPGAPG